MANNCIINIEPIDIEPVDLGEVAVPAYIQEIKEEMMKLMGVRCDNS